MRVYVRSVWVYAHPLPNPPPHSRLWLSVVAVLGVRAASDSVPDPSVALWLAVLSLGCRCLASLAGVVEVELVLLPRFLLEVWVDVGFDVVAIEIIVDIELFDRLAQIYFFHVTFCFLSVMLSQEGLPLNIGFPVLPQTHVLMFSYA